MRTVHGGWYVAVALIFGAAVTPLQLFGVLPVAEWLDIADTSAGFTWILMCLVLFGFMADRWFDRYRPVGEADINLLSRFRRMAYFLAALVVGVFVLSYGAPSGSGTEAVIVGFKTAVLMMVLLQSFNFIRPLRDRVRGFRVSAG